MKFFAETLDYNSQNGIDSVFFAHEEKELVLVMSSVPGTAENYLEWNDQSQAVYNAVDKISFSPEKLEVKLIPAAKKTIGETAFTVSFECDGETFNKMAENLKAIFGDKLDLKKPAAGAAVKQAAPPKNYQNFKILDLKGKKLTALPDYVADMTAIEMVWLEGNPKMDLEAAFEVLSKHPKVRELKILVTDRIPDNIGKLTALEDLNIRGLIQPVSVPASIGKLKSLKTLYIESEADVALPEEFAELGALEDLRMRVASWNLPTRFYRLSKLRTLDFTRCRTAEIPSEVSQMDGLKTLIFMEPSPVDFSKAMPHIARIPNLNTLELSMHPIPDEVKLCRQIKKFTVFGGGTPEDPLVLPEALFELTQLNELVLGYCHIREIPESVGKLKALKVLSVPESELLSSVPDSIGELSELESLNLSQNPLLKQLPDSVGKLSKLQSLSVAESPCAANLPESLNRIAGLNIIKEY